MINQMKLIVHILANLSVILIYKVVFHLNKIRAYNLVGMGKGIIIDFFLYPISKINYEQVSIMLCGLGNVHGRFVVLKQFSWE